MLRRVHEERMVGLFYGQRALCIGAVKPLNYVGTSEHSYAKETPFRRLVHTGNAFEKIYFGTRAEADQVLGYVHRLHERVKGELPRDAGITPAGTRYSALDPALMLWTVAVIADSAQHFFELFVRRLSAREREALWQDYRRFAELFGMPLNAAPATYSEFRAYWNEQLAGEDLFLTDEARYLGYVTAFEIPLPRSSQPSKRIHDLIMLGSLPGRVRELYGIPFTPAQRAAYSAAVSVARAGRRVAPRALAKGWNTRSFDIVEQTERRRIDRGRPTPQVTDGGPVPYGRGLAGRTPRAPGAAQATEGAAQGTGDAAPAAADAAQESSSTTLPVAPRSSSSASASPAASSG
jgi:uncharacterized protein (DUF2236 family)